MQVTKYEVSLLIDRIAGGFPGNVDAYRTYLQNPTMSKSVTPEVRQAFEEQLAEAGISPTGEADTIVRTGFALMPDGSPSIFAYQLKAMLQQAAQAIYDKDSRPNIYQVSPAIKYGLEITPEQIPIVGGAIRPEKVIISQIIEHPRNPQIKVPSTRERTICDGGTLNFIAYVLHEGRAKVLVTSKSAANPPKAGAKSGDAPVLQDLFEAGGMFVGLGTDKGYGHGRFRLGGFKRVGVQDISLSEMGSMVDNGGMARKGAGYVRADQRIKQA